MNEIVDKVICEYKIEEQTWKHILLENMTKAVLRVKPSSRYLNDSIDINKYIKIFLLEWKNQEKCQYINGVVFQKNVAHKRMTTEI